MIRKLQKGKIEIVGQGWVVIVLIMAFAGLIGALINELIHVM